MVLLLPSGLGIGKPFFMHVLDLEKDFKVIAPLYPDVASLDELAVGMHHLAEVEGATRYSVVGQSSGGVVVQVLMRKFAQHVEKCEAVRALYASAERHTFESLGHWAILSERETYLRLIRAFLAA